MAFEAPGRYWGEAQARFEFDFQRARAEIRMKLATQARIERTRKIARQVGASVGIAMGYTGAAQAAAVRLEQIRVAAAFSRPTLAVDRD